MAIVAVVLIAVAGLGAAFYFYTGNPNQGHSSTPSQSKSTSLTTSTSTTQTAIVAGSGSVTLSGQGTQATQLTFAGTPGSFNSPVSQGHYSISLPAPATYSVSAQWTGQYAWQTGSVDLGQLYVGGNSLSFTHDFQGATPDSQVTVSGTTTTSGSGTNPTRVVFVGSAANFTASLTGQQYSVSVPNLATYKVLINWVGGYSWQTGTVVIVGFSVNVPAGSNSQTNAIKVNTPDSIIQVSGALQLSGSQTTATSIVFSLTGGQQQFNVQVSNGQYTVQLPNLAAYSVSVTWTGAFPWQQGTDTNGHLTVNQPAGSTSQTSTIQVSTPNSLIQVSGHATTSTSCTSVSSLTFVTNGQQYQASVSGAMYSLQLPNQAQFTVSAQWSGSYSWQSGTLNSNPVTVNQAAGSASQTSDLSFATPSCLITVTGSISLTFGTSPTLIIFSYNGQVFTATPNGNSYTIQLPNLATYSVSVNWSGYGTSGTCHPSNSLYLNEPPGVSGITGVNWSC